MTAIRTGQARRRDLNEPAIIDALEAIGCVVLQISGEGAPDLLVYARGGWLPIEVKGLGNTLTPAQVKRQRVAPCPVVTTAGEAVALFGVH